MNRKGTKTGEMLNALFDKLKYEHQKSRAEISREIDCSESTLYGWIRDINSPKPPTLPSKMEDLKGLRYLYETYDPQNTESFFATLAQDKNERKSNKKDHPAELNENDNGKKDCWGENAKAYIEKIDNLSEIYTERLSKQLYDKHECHRFAEFFSWLSDDYDAIWYMVKSRNATTFEALSFSYSEKMTALELAQEQERLDYALSNLKELGFSIDLLKNCALYEKGSAPHTIFELGSSREDYQEALLNGIYENRLIELFDFPQNISIHKATDINIEKAKKHIIELIKSTLESCYEKGTCNLKMSQKSKEILEKNRNNGNAKSHIWHLLSKSEVQNNLSDIPEFSDYQAVRSAIEQLIRSELGTAHIQCNYIPSLLYKLFKAAVDKENKQIVVTITDYGRDIYKIIN